MKERNSNIEVLQPFLMVAIFGYINYIIVLLGVHVGDGYVCCAR